jgi:hypothetical protein
MFFKKKRPLSRLQIRGYWQRNCKSGGLFGPKQGSEPGRQSELCWRVNPPFFVIKCNLVAVSLCRISIAMRCCGKLYLFELIWVRRWVQND